MGDHWGLGGPKDFVSTLSLNETKENPGMKPKTKFQQEQYVLNFPSLWGAKSE